MGKRKAVTSKKAWKAIDTTDVEDALVAPQKALLRSADPKHKSDAELFVIDKKGEAQRPGRRDPWELKTTKILSNNSKIPTLESNHPRRRIEDTEEGVVRRMVEEGGKAKKERKKRPSPQDQAFDLWGDELEPKKPDPQMWQLNNKKAQKADSAIDPAAVNISIKAKRAAARLRPEPSCVPAVQVPHAGASYRPSAEAHEELMGKAAAMLFNEEEKKRISQLRAGGVINRNLLQAGPRSQTQIDEHDLPEEKEEEEEEAVDEEKEREEEKARRERKRKREAEEEDEEEDEEGGARGGRVVGISVGDAVVAKTMTRAERNKQARNKQREQELEQQRQAKRANKQLNRIGEVSKEVRKEVREREAAAHRRALLKPEVEAAKVRRLGPYKLQPKAPEVLLPEEVPKNFRSMPATAVNPLKERFEGLQKRNLIEARFPKSKRKTLGNRWQGDRKAKQLKQRAYIDF